MKKIIIEVGSTVTKVSRCDGNNIVPLTTKTITFKENYKKNNCLDKNDIKMLEDIILEIKKQYDNIEVYGTSIFRSISDNERDTFIALLYNNTGVKFTVISQKDENEITVKGIVRGIKEKVAIFIGGGGSIEMAICEDGKILEMTNSKIGVVDITEKFPNLADDIAMTSVKEIRDNIKGKLELPKMKADVLILGGGGHKYFALESGITYEENKLYQNSLQPIMMNIETRKIDTEKYFKEISLDKIRDSEEDPNWWNCTRAMCATILEVADELEVKYIVPTDIGLVYGLID